MISVLYSPLFTAVYDDGSVRQVGMMELLTTAHRITELKANSCTGKLALTRLLIAFVSAAYKPRRLRERRRLLEQRRFDREVLEDYASSCEKDGPCFLLDDEKRPFMQAAYDEALDAKAEKPIAKILFDCPGGNNHIHLDHRLEHEHSIDTADAFEAMLETYLLCPAGLSGSSNVNNTPPLYAILHGGNLFETLTLNMVSMEEIGNIPYGEGEAAWERNEQIIPGNREVGMSLLKAFTWQPRRLTLQWEEDGSISRLYLQNGLNFIGNGLWMDPHVPYRAGKNGGWVSVKPELGRELWRDAGTLLCNGAKYRSPATLQNLQNGIWPDQPDVLDVEIIGLITNQEAILGRSDERLRLPAQLIEEEDLANEFVAALEYCEQMYRELDRAVKWQFCHAGDKKKRSDVAAQATEVFLHAMHDVLFGDYVQWLTGDMTFSERSERYKTSMWQALDGPVLGGVVEQTGDDVNSIKRQNAVRGMVRKSFGKLWGGS